MVANLYREQGYQIIGRNVRMHSVKQLGEIDIIAVKGKQLVFVEVKTRRSNYYGTGAEAVNWQKQRRLVRSAKLYILKNPRYAEYMWQIDVAEVDIDNTQNPVIIFSNAIEDTE